MSDAYAVFGNPIAHSRSPEIHRAFASQTEESLIYTRQLVERDGFDREARAFFESGGRGLNVTVPFKLDASGFADRLSMRARQAGAVNTLSVDSDGLVMGDNTDGVGLVRDLGENLGWSLRGRKILLLGAGGAVRGVIGPLLEVEPAEIVVANRTLEKAQTLATLFAASGPITACAYADLQDRRFDLIINGTSAGLGGEVPSLPADCLASDASCYDMVYGSGPTAFLRWAREKGVDSIADGLGMLVEQAAESFYLWRGRRPETAPVRAMLRQLLAEAADASQGGK